MLFRSIVKNKLPELAEFLPSIDKIECLESKAIEPGICAITNHWYAKLELPALVKKFLSQDLLCWKDVAVWNDHEKFVRYELESFIANDLFTAKGCNSFESLTEANKMRLNVTCDVSINPEKIPGVPRLLMKKIVPLIEKIIEKMLRPNLTSLGSGLRAYLEK